MGVEWGEEIIDNEYIYKGSERVRSSPFMINKEIRNYIVIICHSCFKDGEVTRQVPVGTFVNMPRPASYYVFLHYQQLHFLPQNILLE